jgi:esterase/lipase
MIKTLKTIIEADNLKIAVKDSGPENKNESDLPIIILPPGLNRTMKDYFIYAAYFVSNDFRVIRFDNINHPGLSSGEILDYTLSDSIYCLDKVIKFIKERYPNSTISLLSSSIMARVTMKYLSYRESFRHVGLVLPVVNLEQSVTNITGENYYDMEKNNVRRDSFEIFDQIISWKCIQDSIEHDFETYNSTLSDLHTSNQPLGIFIAKEDPWVNFEEVKAAFENRENCIRISLLEGSTHEIGRNITAMKIMLKEIVSHFCAVEYGEEYETVIPNFQKIILWSKEDRSLNFNEEAETEYA